MAAAYVPTGPDLVVIRAVDPPGPTVVCRHGDGLASFASAGGWQFTKRPKRTSMTEWMGPDAYTLKVPIQFGNGWDPTINIEPTFEALRGIMRNPVGPRNEPAVVTVTCPIVPLTWLRWIIADLSEVDALRGDDGTHFFGAYMLTLYQWEPTDLVIATGVGQSIAQKIAAAPVVQSSGVPASTGGGGSTPTATASSGWTYTVKSGDTLESIAASQLGDASRWQEIRTLNNIRDPRTIQPGQVLRMPGKGPVTSGIPGYGPGQGHGPSGTTGVAGYAPGQGHGPSGIG